MRVAVTGGTGFVGSHTAKALLERGHTVRLVVRNPDRVAPALEPLGVDPNSFEVATADVTDQTGLKAAIDGVDAIVHAASVFSFDPRKAAEIARTADMGVRAVLDAAVAAGLDPIVHVSSTLALLRDDLVGDTLSPTSPPGNSPHPYCGSKARQEAYAQQLQREGAPVVITNPGSVWGPHDPYDGESQQLARNAVLGRMGLLPEITLLLADVRDVAAVHAAVLEPGRGPRRYVIASDIPLDRVVEIVTSAYGRPRKVRRVPLGAARVVGAIGSALRGSFGVDLGIVSETVWVGSRASSTDASAVTTDLGITLYEPEQTILDQTRWMKEHDRF